MWDTKFSQLHRNRYNYTLYIFVYILAIYAKSKCKENELKKYVRIRDRPPAGVSLFF
jgi:hypothetical protein